MKHVFCSAIIVFLLFVDILLAITFGWVRQAFGGVSMEDVEEHIPCHKGAYTGKSGITRDRTGKPWYYRNLKR